MANCKKKNKPLTAIIAVAALAVVIIAMVFIAVFAGSAESTPGQIQGDAVGTGVNGVHSGTDLDSIDISQLPDATSPVRQTNETGSTVISLSDSGITVDGQGAVANGSYLKIVQGGTYTISGALSDGRIAVRAPGEDVVLILNGVNITCSDFAPLYINKAASVTLVLNGTSENIFTDGADYNYSLEYADAAEEEPKACIFSKADMIIRGTGSLTVNANFNSGIICKDTLQILDTTVSVSSVNNGINGKDSLTVQNSTVVVNAVGDALRSTQDNDPALGWASFKDSNVYLVTCGDGMQIETAITVDNCSISVTAGVNGAEGAASDTSAKGLKCNQGNITVNSGTIILNTSDDGLHSAGDIEINGGTISIATGDDALHADSNVYILGGKINISDCHEGLEGALIEISGGEVYIIADDDGINASGGNDASSQDMRGMFASDGSYLGITGGFVYINSQGDGIDSNGDIYMSGGTLIVSGPVFEGDSAIDYNGDFCIDGGLLFAAGSSGMAQAPDNLTVNALSITFERELEAGSFVSVSGGESEFVFCVEKNTGNIVFSSPELETGITYTISYGGKYSGDVNYCVGSGGNYSGGTELSEVTLTEGLNSYGRVGIGGSMGGRGFGQPGQFGGMGGEGHNNPFGGRGGWDGGRPDDMPEPPDGGFGGGMPPDGGGPA